MASAGLTVGKGVVGLTSGSLAMLSEAAHSFSDLVATILTYFAVRVSGKPADAEHHYGHGKVESIAALVETALLFLISGVVIWEAIRRLIGHEAHAVEATALAFAVVIISIVVDFFRARVLNRVAKETASEALEADALHFSSDMWSSAAVLVGLAGVAFGFSWADSLAALIVAVFICVAGWRLGSRTISSLTDEAPPGSADQIETIAGRVAGVDEVERVRVRRSGPVLFVDLALAVSRTLPIDRIDGIKKAVVDAVARELPRAEVAITTAPRALDSETVVERVLVIARNRAQAVHHVTVHSVGDKLAVSLDLEVEGGLTLAAAHEIATQLENAIEDELGSEVEVETHIEPLEIEDQSGQDASPARVREVSEALTVLSRESVDVRNVHAVRVRQTQGGEIVNFHCYVDPTLTVQAVHERVDDVERALRRRFPEIRRVIGHAEPRG